MFFVCVQVVQVRVLHACCVQVVDTKVGVGGGVGGGGWGVGGWGGVLGGGVGVGGGRIHLRSDPVESCGPSERLRVLEANAETALGHAVL